MSNAIETDPLISDPLACPENPIEISDTKDTTYPPAGSPYDESNPASSPDEETGTSLQLPGSNFPKGHEDSPEHEYDEAMRNIPKDGDAPKEKLSKLSASQEESDSTDNTADKKTHNTYNTDNTDNTNHMADNTTDKKTHNTDNNDSADNTKNKADNAADSADSGSMVVSELEERQVITEPMKGRLVMIGKNRIVIINQNSRHSCLEIVKWRVIFSAIVEVLSVFVIALNFSEHWLAWFQDGRLYCIREHWFVGSFGEERIAEDDSDQLGLYDMGLAVGDFLGVREV